jgi:acetyl esterase/lipase
MNKLRTAVRKITGELFSSPANETGSSSADPGNKEIFLWPNTAPGSEVKKGNEKIRVSDGEQVISNIHHPSLTPYLPPKEKNTGAAVIIAPGGSHMELWIDHEGHDAAQWFCEMGVAAFVLKYRLAKEKNSSYTVEEHALADIHRALRLVRSNTKDWGIDSSKIGVMGFSAGGQLAALSAMHFDDGKKKDIDPIEHHACRPDFQALIYPSDPGKYTVTKKSPPVFITGGYKDYPEISKGMATLYLKYKEAGIPAELHIYASADHGFGMRETNKGAAMDWPSRVLEWLADIGMIKSND